MDSIGFFDKARLMEVVGKTLDPSPSLVSAMIRVLRQDTSLLLVFVKSPKSARWVRALHAQGFFSSPPSGPVDARSGDSTGWLEGMVLVEAAADVPDVVESVVASVHTDNPEVIRRLTDAVAAQEVDVICRVWPRLLGLVAGLRDWFALKALANMATRLADANHVDRVIEFLREILQPLDPQPKKVGESDTLHPLPPQPKEFGEFYMNTEARGRFKKHALDDYVSPLIRRVDSMVPLASVNVLRELLVTTLRLESDVEHQERSYWRSSIEPSDQNILQHHRDYLLEALRDCLEQGIDTAAGRVRDAIEFELASDLPIFRRLALHLIRVGGNRYADLAARELLRPGALDDLDTHHEIFLLLRDSFDHLPTSAQEQVIAAIKKGPGAENLERLAKWVGENTDDTRSQAEIMAQRHRSWTLDRLSMIRGHLPDEDAEALAEYEKILGDRRMPPEFTAYVGRAQFGLTSPMDVEELSKLPTKQVVDLLLQWEPESIAAARHEAAPEALAREFCKDLRVRWNDYVPELERLLKGDT